MINNALLVALRMRKHHFVELLIDQDLSAELNFHSFLTMNTLYTLYKELVSSNDDDEHLACRYMYVHVHARDNYIYMYRPTKAVACVLRYISLLAGTCMIPC